MITVMIFFFLSMRCIRCTSADIKTRFLGKMSKRNDEFDALDEYRKRVKCVDPISTFETMSNELWMEIFEYFDLYALYSTFYSLNSRFNSIICHSQVHVNLNQINSLYFTSFIGQFIRSNIEQGRIRSLQCSIPHQLAVLVNDIVMDRFTLLRSLTLSRCSVDLVEQVLNRMERSCLEKISISSCKRVVGKRFSLTQHLLSSERYPSLRSINLKLCARNMVYLHDVEISVEKLHRLEYLSLDRPSEIEDLSNIFYRSPNLRSLTTVLSNLTNPSSILTEIMRSSSLSRLKLTSSLIQQSTLEYLLDRFPNLSVLYLDFSTRSSSLIDAKYWRSLLEKMSYLKYVYIRMIIQLSQTNLSREQVRERVRFFDRSLFFTRILIHRMNNIRITINRIK